MSLLFVVALGIAIIDAGAKRPIDWSKSYNFRDKIPYGLFVFRSELPQILGSERSYSDFGESMYELIAQLDSMQDYRRSILDIYPNIGYDQVDAKVVLSYIREGGEVFLSGEYLGEQLLDTLGIQVETLRETLFMPTDKNISYSLEGDTSRIHLAKAMGFRVFSKLDAKTCTILGQLHARGRAIPNFVRVSLGKGTLYLHLLPEVFTNYHLLQKGGYEYASKAVQAIQGDKVVLSDYYFESEQSRTPLRVILTNPGFYQAWYLLLFGLLVLFVFKSKREQRAVKIVKPEQNLSKEFAKTIGTLYYENGHPGNIIHKKIDYFLYTIRSNYQVETMNLLDEKFLRVLSLKTAVSVEETTALFSFIHECKSRNDFTIEEVKKVNRRIEEFKSKANII
ncbi:hypothetical protein SAMN05660841_04023 [Sphingobacterium nematocida]|uniref:DUF4350 domain-containing protein n=1 Tax=Sphingobacterium nematocida TaxID=1513896 RepID=A0A1T5GGJ9_9SPHI|nr:hypothetical protein SAMN05660841_04023 [Sphingobacterium nematocida]